VRERCTHGAHERVRRKEGWNSCLLAGKTADQSTIALRLSGAAHPTQANPSSVIGQREL